MASHHPQSGAPLPPDVAAELERKEERIAEMEAVLRVIMNAGGAYSRTARATLERAGR